LKNWSKDELDYLQNKWGEVSIPNIAKFLGKSINAIKIKAIRIGLGRHIHSGEYITLNQLMIALGRPNAGGYIYKSWIENRNMPVKYKKTIKREYMIIYLDDFWEWAEQNRTFLDFNKIEVGVLGAEPDWVKTQRTADIKYAAYKRTPWTKDEDSLLKQYLSRYEYSYRYISVKMRRTEGAIKQRIRDLGIKSTPVKADNHTKWTSEEEEILRELYAKGYRPEVIAEHIDRSATAIRGKIEREYLYKKEKVS